MSRSPLLLHGFLGCKEDWQDLCQHIDSLPIDWSSKEDILAHAGRPVIGYSMGGRLALQLREHFTQVIVISAHPGLHTGHEERRQQDELWAQKLEDMPIDDFLKEWYAQPIFGPVDNATLERRRKIDPLKAAEMLRTHTLANQPYITDATFIHGANDTKYANLYRPLPKTLSIPDAAHAVHLDNPKTLSEELIPLLMKG